MIPNASAVASVESTFGGEQITMGFDEKAINHIMGILSEMYTDPTLAVAREYITNAIDSHDESGQTAPVKVTLPAVWGSNTLSIQDFGLGMNADDIRNTYSLYGASTKRDSNVASGMLGIGSKSAFAYSNSFTVTGIKDGVKTIVVVSRDEDGRGSMTIVDETETDEGNGVTIQVPVTNGREMRLAVEKFCQYLPAGKVEVDGKDLSIRHKWTLVASDIKDADGNVIIKNIWSDESQQYGYQAKNYCRVIMGSVAYQPNSSLIDDNDWSSPPVIAEVAMGAVTFSPSREKLMDVNATRNVERLIASTYKKHLAESMLKAIADSPTHYEAMVNATKYRARLSKLGFRDLKYKGELIPGERQMAVTSDVLVARSLHHGTSYGVYGSHNTLTWGDINDATFVVPDADDVSITPTIRKKTAQYANKHNMSIDAYNSSVLFFPASRTDTAKLLKSKWLRGVKEVSYADIKAEVLPKAPRTGTSGGGVKTSGKHYVINDKGEQELQVVDNDAKILYFVKSQLSRHSVATLLGESQRRGEDYDYQVIRYLSTIRAHMDKDTLLINVYANRLDRFIREHPNAELLTSDKARQILADSARNSVTDEMLYHSFLKDSRAAYSVGGWRKYLPTDDPDVQAMVKAIDEGDRHSRVIKIADSLLSDDQSYKDRKEVQSSRAAKLAQELLVRYPLISTPWGYADRMTHSKAERYLRYDYETYKASQKKGN